MTARNVFVATYPPRRCGIATFTLDLAGACGDAAIAVLHSPDGPDVYPSEVKHRIRRDVRGDYVRVARALNDSDARVVSVQHEYGIWGGVDGSYVLDFVAALTKPVVSTLHTVPQHPSPGQRRVLMSLIRASAASVVMSRSAASLLERVYGVDKTTLDVVPHGVPHLPCAEPDSIKPRLGMPIAPMILSFGLLGPGKGYEAVIEAMPSVVAADPTAYYVILGATHPELLRREGEAYRNGLKERAVRLGVADHVNFVDRFVTRAELGTWLTAADIFVTPYPNPDQIVSGTLAYAMSAGKAIVSTRYSYAVEMLEAGRGLLVPSSASDDLGGALIGLIGDRGLRARLGRKAYEFSRTMIWPEVGARYRRIFDRVGALDTRELVAAASLGSSMESHEMGVVRA
jgi:glycosyltransferase involved in cell wall biosynthesis